MASTEQHYSLRWNDYTVKIVTAFQSLRDEEDFVDVTVACDGHHYSAHKMVLSACSPYFRSLLRANPCQHPIVILKDVGHIEMERLLEFMYNGEVNIAQDQLAAFLKTAENLKIRGLAGSSEDIDQIHSRDSSHHYISCGSGTGANGGASGRSSPTLSFIPSQGTADDIAGEGGANSHHHSDSPPNKRRKRISIPSAGHPESNSASHNTDSLVADGNTIEDATTATGRSSSGGLVDDDLRIDRRELKSEPSDSVGEVYSEPSEISGEPQHAGDGLDSRQPILYPLAAMPGHSGPSTSGQENLGSQEPGAPGGAVCEALNLSLRPVLPLVHENGDFQTAHAASVQHLHHNHQHHAFHRVPLQHHASDSSYLKHDIVDMEDSYEVKVRPVVVAAAVPTDVVFSDVALDLAPPSDKVRVAQDRTQPSNAPFVEVTQLVRPSDYKTAKLYPCPECQKVFRHPMSLHHHRHVHKGTYTCDSCGKVFSRRWDLHRHVHRSKMGCRRPNNAATQLRIVTTAPQLADIPIDLNNPPSN